MTIYYVGPGGNDGNTGLSWAQRFLTLNGAEDEPVAAGDTVYVAPGVYRELLTVDIDGTSGNEITYIADVTGENTDGVGGVVRITGSDNDQTATRSQAVNIGDHDYRTFRGFRMDTTTGDLISMGTSTSTGSPTNIIIEDCFFTDGGDDLITIIGDSQSDVTIRRCFFTTPQISDMSIEFQGTSAQDGNHIIENCIFVSGNRGVHSIFIGGITIKNCLFLGRPVSAIRTASSPGANTINVNNCIFHGCQSALTAVTSGDIVEDYNCFFLNGTDRTNVSTGANSISYVPLFSGVLLFDSIRFPWTFGTLSEWSQIAAIAGSSEATDDFFGMTRPTTSSKKSWGAIQFVDSVRETGTTYDGSDASIKLADAGRHQMFVPVANESTTFSLYVYREANYAGTNPQLIVKQPGQSDDTTTDTGSSGAWNQLSTTLTPAADPPYGVVELVSNNTATSGSYDVFFDALSVS